MRSDSRGLVDQERPIHVVIVIADGNNSTQVLAKTFASSCAHVGLFESPEALTPAAELFAKLKSRASIPRK